MPYFSVLADDPGAWPQILSSVGLQRQAVAAAHVLVARAGTAASSDWTGRVEQGAILVLEGASPLAEEFGFRPGRGRVRVTGVIDVHRPKLPIVWKVGVEVPVFELPDGAQVFAHDRWDGAPVIAGMHRGLGAVLWVAVSPGERGYERFPFLLNALCDLGFEPPFRSSRLWAFFDSSYRSRVDLDYFAARWRESGISALHVAAWHFYDADPELDLYLQKLIAACHREGILVYAWFELPHVSEKFWDDHPQWREKTAMLQDAHLDWRKLMNLTNRDCQRAAAAGVKELIGRFDWDGVNLAELYFESLEGIDNPSRFTPMNDDVRAEFRQLHGFDPIELFGKRKDPASLKAFLDFRCELARRIQEEWIGGIEARQNCGPHLDVVLTHVDDRFDTGMRDAIGADSARVLPLLDLHSFTFLIEDPATVWHLGPERYGTIAERYRTLTSHGDRLAVDLNIVDRYQNVYPTKQPAGLELLQLVHNAAANFERVALYFESSLLPPDWKLLPSAAAGVTRCERLGSRTVVHSAAGVGMPWKGGAMVDGVAWPAADDGTVWLPAGDHWIEPTRQYSGLRLLRLNGELRSARVVGDKVLEFSYSSTSRAIAVLNRAPRQLRIDQVAAPMVLAGAMTVLLPHGQHVVTITSE